MTTYISLYRDADGSVFVGQPYEVETPEDVDRIIEAEKNVLKDIPVITSVELCEVKHTISNE